jgi:O-antigen/teichoic acid export membrane protein
MSANVEQSLELEPGSLARSLPGPAPNLGGLDEAAAEARDGRLSGLRDVRRHVASGMITNGAFQVGLLGLTAARGFAVAAFMSKSDYGLWGLIGLTLWTGLALKNQFGAGEKYVQQSEANQQHAFERAFTIDVIFSCVATAVAAAVVVGVALGAGQPRVLAPGFVLLLMIPAMVLQFPVTTLYRRLQFRRQRALLAIDPVVTAVATIGLAIAGAGYWSFVLGTLAGSWLAAIVIAYSSPFPLRFRYDHGSLRQYIRFSAPLLVTAIAILALFQVIYLVGTHAIGIAALGAFTLAGNLVQFTDQADAIVTQTLYPAVCAVKDRPALLSEIFVKSNRLSLMWAIPFGIGLTLFAPDLIRLVFGPTWLPAVPVLQILGAVTAVHHVGYNWAAFVKARAITWPIAASGVATAAVTIAAAVPLMYADGVVGLAWAFAVGEVVSLVIRAAILSRFFEGIRILSQLLRAFAPTLVAAVPVVALRALAGAGHSTLGAVASVALYVAVTVLATAALERPLLREAMGYLLRRSPQLAH